MQAPVNPSGSSAINCHLTSGPFTGRQWQLCSFGRDGSWLEATEVGTGARGKAAYHAHLLWSIPRCPRRTVWHCMAARGISWQWKVFHAKGQILFSFLQWKWEQKKVLFPWANINTFPFGSVPAKDLFWTEKQRFTTSPQGLRCRALQLYQWGLYTEIPQSASGNLCITVYIRLLLFSVYLFQFWRLFFKQSSNST